MNKTLEAVAERHPVGTKVRYRNPGKRGDGNVAEIVGYLHRTGTPDRVAYIELQFPGCRRHTVTVNQIRTYYVPEPA